MAQTAEITDLNPLSTRDASFQNYGAALVLQDTDLPAVGPVLNMARYTEDMSWAYHQAAGSTVKTGATKTAIINGRPVTLNEITVATFYEGVSTNLSGAGHTPFVVGKKYMASQYVWSAESQWFWMVPMSDGTDYGHSPFVSPKGVLSRIWRIGVATSTSAIDFGKVPTVALGSGAGVGMPVIFSGNTGACSVYIGGLCISAVPDAYKDGVAVIGDSTIAGGSGFKDFPRDFRIMGNREVTTVLAARLRVPFFNRAVGGERLDNMDARWATDITPLKVRCSRVLIQGGINDVGQGRTLAQIQAPIQSMTAKAVADGLIPLYMTITPTNTIGADPAKEAVRLAANAWIKATYGAAVHDSSAVVEDPDRPGYLRPEFWGDGVHYPGIAKTSIADDMVQTLDWSWILKPPAYRPVYR